MKKLLIAAVAIIAVFIFILNSSFLSDQATAWVKEHPKDPNSADVLYDVGRWCDLTGDNDKAIELYTLLYHQYPERGDLCAPGLYHCAAIKANGSYIRVIRLEAIPYLETIINQYPNQDDWGTKAKQLYDEVMNGH